MRRVLGEVVLSGFVLFCVFFWGVSGGFELFCFVFFFELVFGSLRFFPRVEVVERWVGGTSVSLFF